MDEHILAELGARSPKELQETVSPPASLANATVAREETISFFVVEPLDGSNIPFSHLLYLPQLKDDLQRVSLPPSEGIAPM